MSIASLQLVGAQYSELNTKLLVRHRQLMSTAGQAFLTQIKELKGETELTDDLVRTLVDQWGFHQQWIDEVESSKKKSSKAKAKATATGLVTAIAGLRPLPELLQPVALPAVPVPANDGIVRVPKAKAAAVPTPAAAVPPAKAGPGPTPRPVLGVPVPSPTAASAVPPVASEMPPVASEMPPEMPPVASGNPNESNPDVADGPTPDEIEADLAEDHPSGSQNPEVESKLLILIAYL